VGEPLRGGRQTFHGRSHKKNLGGNLLKGKSPRGERSIPVRGASVMKNDGSGRTFLLREKAARSCRGGFRRHGGFTGGEWFFLYKSESRMDADLERTG